MKPGEVTISENNVDNRLVVEVFGRQIDLNSILPKVEAALLSNPKIEEVRFIAGTIFKIDANLDKEVWRGRNIVVCAKEVIVCQPVQWNVSGKDSVHTYEQNAGTAEDGNGLDGKDGYPGESGGNVLITANRIKSLEKLTILSNGGKGSNGQDGGNGAAGKDGTGITRKEFDLAFPPVCPASIYSYLKQTYRNIGRVSDTVLEEWLQSKVLFVTTTYTSDVINIIQSSISPDFYDGFLKCSTEEGHKITFSYQSGAGIDNSQAFLLVEGSEGTPGKLGGEYGLGGEGGKPGEIHVASFEGKSFIAANTCTKIGADGVNGKGGVRGRQGKRGWDMAYMDYTLGRISGNWPKYYGRDEKSSLKLDYYRRSADDRVRCPYEKEYPWAGITVSKIEDKTMATLKERNNSRSNSERQHHARAVGKKTISRQRVVNTYSEFMKNIEAEINEEHVRRAQEERLAAQTAAELDRQQQIQQEQARRAQEERLAAQRAAELERQRQIQQEQARRAQEERLAAQRAAELERHRQIQQEQARRAQEERLAAQRAAELENQQQIQQELSRRAQEERLAAQRADELEVQKQIQQEQARIAQEELRRQQEQARRAQEERLAAQRAAELEKQQQIQQEQARIAQDKQLVTEMNQLKLQNTQEQSHAADNIPSSERHTMEEELQEFSSKRHVPFNPGPERHKVKVKVSSLAETNVDTRMFTKTASLNLDDWLELNTFFIDCEGIKKLMIDFSTVKASLNEKLSKEHTTQIQTIENMFLDKYKLAALHETTHILELDQTIDSRTTVQVQIASKHLTESKAKDNLIGPTVLGTMKQYIFENTQEQRDNIAKYVAQELKNDDTSFQRVLKAFVLETEYVELVNESLEILRKELRNPQHENIRRFWDGFDDKPLEDGVREMMERDETLKKHYDRWNEMKRKASQYESDQTTSVEDGLREKFIKHIQSKGIASKCCRTLLAYLYNVNLRVYERDEDYELVLRENHNSSADKSTHILSRGTEFGQLKVNEEYLKLEQHRLHRDTTYGKILREMDTLKSIEQIDNYLEKGCVLPQSIPGMIEECHFDDKSAAETIANFFPPDERDELRPMLEKVAFEVCKQKGILQHMLRRFSYEGKDISINEMCFFINAVLDHFADDGQEEYYFAWIVAAYSQRFWLHEIILLQLETYFKKHLADKQQWREYLRKIENKEVLMEFAAELQDSVCSEECVGEILHLMSSVPIESMFFDGIPLSEWGYFLKEHVWTDKLRHVLEWDKDQSLGDATYYIQSLENAYGESKASDLLHKIKAKDREVTVTILLDILVNLHKQKWKLSDEDIGRLDSSNLQEWIAHMHEKYKPTLQELTIDQLAEIIENDKISSTELIQHLPRIRTSIHNIWDTKIKHNETSVSLFMESDIKGWVKEFREKKDNSAVEYCLDTYEEILAVIDRAIVLKRGFRLRDTQRLTVLILLTNDRSTLAQVSTGEGKSLIVVALSIIKALLGEKVDIVTSSSVLAKRDSEVNNDIYSLFNIDVSHNCSDNIEQRKDAYSMHQVVYGDLANFQRDYLLDRFYGKNILGDRDFTNVIVDEVDSMLLDKGNNMLYLSHDIPGMDKLESVYIFIWQMVNDSNERPEDIDVDMVKEEVLNSMYNTITLDDLLQLDKCLSERRANMIWNCLLGAGILNEEGHIIADMIDSTRLGEVLAPEVKQYNHRLNFLLKECVECEISIKVPNHLKKFVERHLTSWIISAINALLMQPGQSYVVDYNKSGAKADRNAGIIILDKDTGADQGSSQWDEALHQFLQLKHGCKLSMQSLKAVFVSNVTYFKMYKLLYGLTGTLGSQRERNLLKEIHQVAFVTIPTAKSKQFEEYEPIISQGHRKWLESITIETDKLINHEKRSVLIICDTINDAECIENALKKNFPNNIHPYTRDYQEFEIVQGNKQLQQGQIIIATNLAGRGTDIRITDGLKKAGGLHVMLTFLPENIRIEEQAFGRAARSGDKGSGRLIIMVSSLKQLRKSKIIDLRKKRDQKELQRISDIKTYYEKTITAEEICFDEFKKVYEMHRKGLDSADVPAEVKMILLQTCLDQWSFWLDEYSDLMEDIMSDRDDRKIPTVLKKFLAKLSKLGTGVDGTHFDSNRWKTWVSGNPMRMVKLANYLSEFHVKKSRMELAKQMTKKVVNACTWLKPFDIEKEVEFTYETAMSLYGDVIRNEPQFSEAAHYYRAYTLMKTIEWEETTQSTTDKQKFKDFKNDLREATRLFEGHCAFAMQATAIVDKLKGNTFWYEDYKAQKESICQLYQSFIRSIEDIFGHAVTPNTFVHGEIKENLSEHIFMQLIEKGVIACPKVRKTISERQLYNIHKDYGISIEALKEFLKTQAGPIDVEEFLEEFRKSFPLPTVEHFWGILIDQKVLHSVEKYVLVDLVKLAVVDPSLTNALNAAVLNKTLVKATIELHKDQIVLYHDLVKPNDSANDVSKAKSNNLEIFEKDHFIALIGREKFVMLTKKGIVRCNEKANIDKNKMASCKFPTSFDTVSAEVIVRKANIAIDEAKLIIDELVSQQFLVRNGDSYVMADGLSSSEQDLLPTYPLYESSIRAILASCFAYRLAFENLKAQLEANEQELRIKLKCNPYPKLFQDFLNQNIIRPIIVKEPNLNDKLDKIFRLQLIENFIRLLYGFQMVPMLSRSLYTSPADAFLLYEQVTVSIDDILGTTFTEVGRVIESINNPIQAIANVTKQFNISDEKPKPATTNSSIHFEPTNQPPGRLQYDMGKTVEEFLAQKKVFYKKETKDHVESVLKQMKPSLVGLKVPNIQLKSILEVTKFIEHNFGNIDEIQLFNLNGLPHLLHLVEKQWSKEMLINVGLVVGIGIAQIVVGALIEVKSAGGMTHVASGLMSEGISDIMYAVNSFKSGYFSWEDYRSEKWKSILFTVATTGVAAYFSRGTKVFRIANKVSEPGLTKDGKEIAKMTGRAMIDEIGGKKVFRETVKRIVMKTTQGFAQGLAGVMVDKFTDEYLQSLIESIAADMLSQIVGKVDDHKISVNLKKMYDELGEDQARKLILQLPAFGSNDWDAFISYTKQITSSLSQGFASAMQKTQNQTRTLKILSNLSTAWVWAERANEIGKLMTVIGTFLDNLDHKMNEKYKTMLQNSTHREDFQSNEAGNFEQFKAEIVNEWKMQLTEHVGRIISQQLVKPLLHDALHRVGKFIKRIPRNIRQRILRRRMKREQKKYAKKMEESNLSQETKAILKQEYHDKLLKIMYKTKSPSLFADIIKEGVPMDLTCAKACTPLVQALLTKMGTNVKGIAVTIKGENGIEQTFCSGSLDGANVREVVLQLKDNHFTFSDNQLNTSDNNCFYAALCEAIPELKNISAKEFRDKIADTIRQDTDVQHRIRQGWHRFPIKKYNAVGGRSLPLEERPKRVKTFRQQERKPAIPRASGADHLKPLAVEFEKYTPPENCPTAKSAALHLYARLTIYDFEFAGLIQGIVAKTGIQLATGEELTKEGASNCKDDLNQPKEFIKEGASNCKDDLKLVKGGNIHRAHTIRGYVNEDALKDHPEELAKLKQYAGHREYVCKEANQFDKIGGVIDKKQMEWIKHLVKTHDFSKKPTDQDKLSMRDHLVEAVKVFDYKNASAKNKSKNNNKSKKYDATMIQQMEIAKEKILSIDLEKLHEFGQHGFNAI